MIPLSSIYKESDYRKFLRARLAVGKEEGWGSITKWAKAIACQHSHASRVLSGDKDLSPEQAIATADFLKLTEAEADYFLLLVETARAGSRRYRDLIQKKMREAQRENLARQLETNRVDPGVRENTYYSGWWWSAIHILVSIPAFQTSEKIAERLRLPLEGVKTWLKRLEEFGLIRQEKGRWVFDSASMHLPLTSPLATTHHQNWRTRAVVDSQNPDSDGLHYTIVQSISGSDYERFKAQLYAVIEDYQRLAGPSRPEELISFSCDFFRV